MNFISKALVSSCAIALLATTVGASGESKKKMLTEAKVDRTHAELIALSRARGGKIKESEIEREHGRLIWSCDIVMPNTRTITEVQVDAETGKVVSVGHETAAQEAKEAHAQKH